MPSAIVREDLTVLAQPARVHVGGDGPALLLVHGGFGGASMHWSCVWERLAERFRVVAPELPGLGVLDQAPLGSVAAYAEWLVALLDVLGIPRAHCVGNSFGGSLVWALAGREGERCDGAVLVNAIPMPPTPGPMLALGRTSLGRTVMRRLLRKFSYNPEAVERAFVDPSRAPAELVAMLEEEEPVLLRRFAEILIEGDDSPTPKLGPLLLWGDSDRLPGTSAAHARKLATRLPGAILRFIRNAGHYPQLEAPDAFVDALDGFAR